MIGETDVSRETAVRLARLSALVSHWNAAINLVAPGTLDDIWTRHIADSAQLHRRAPDGGHWVDLGSGGGFPGLVVAILSGDGGSPRDVTLVEADTRKAVFLRTAARELELEVAVISARAESIPALHGDIVSARALAPLPRLLPLLFRHLSGDGSAMLLKGARFDREKRDAVAKWRFDCEEWPSETQAGAVVARIWNIRHAS